MQGRQGFRGVSTPSHHRLCQQINQLYKVRFFLSRLWERVVFDSGASHSFIVASVVI